MDLKLLIVCFFVQSSFAVTLYEGHQVWRVIPDSIEKLEILTEIGDKFELDFWKDPTAIGIPIDFRVPANLKNQIEESLESKGILDFQVYINDILELIYEERISNLRSDETVRNLNEFDYSRYHTPEEVYEWIDMIATEYDFVTKRQYGVSYQGRPSYALEFKKNSTASPKPIMFLDSLIHCREWISMAATMFMFNEMLTNPDYTHMLDEVDWYYVPMINVDGYDETWKGDRLWRKTKSTGPSSLCAGVDGNRNWDAHWSYPGASKHPCSYTYYGPMPASESEIRHLANYILGIGKNNVNAYISTHSYWQLILYAHGYTEELSPHDAELNVTGKLMHDAIIAVHGKYYTYGPSSTTIYVSSGSTTDWTYESVGANLSYTYELRDEGQYGFLLPADQIIPNGEEYLAGVEALSDYVVEKFHAT